MSASEVVHALEEHLITEAEAVEQAMVGSVDELLARSEAERHERRDAHAD